MLFKKKTSHKSNAIMYSENTLKITAEGYKYFPKMITFYRAN